MTADHAIALAHRYARHGDYAGAFSTINSARWLYQQRGDAATVARLEQVRRALNDSEAKARRRVQ